MSQALHDCRQRHCDVSLLSCKIQNDEDSNTCTARGDVLKMRRKPKARGEALSTQKQRLQSSARDSVIRIPQLLWTPLGRDTFPVEAMA